MKQKVFLFATMLLVAFAAMAQRYPTRKVAEFTDARSCRYQLVQNPAYNDTGLENIWVLQKVPLKGSQVKIILNPFDIEGSEYGAIKDAKRIGDKIYVINTSYRQGDNVACLNTRTGKWTNPVKQCSECMFLDGNKLLVRTPNGFSDGYGYTFTEKVITLP